MKVDVGAWVGELWGVLNYTELYSISPSSQPMFSYKIKVGGVHNQGESYNHDLFMVVVSPRYRVYQALKYTG